MTTKTTKAPHKSKSAETQTPDAPTSVSGMFFTKSGQILQRKMDKAYKSVIIPINNGDKRLFVKGGELVSPFVNVSFKHIQNVKAAGFLLAIYEETAASEFDPTDMVPIEMRSLEVDFKLLNPGVA